MRVPGLLLAGSLSFLPFALALVTAGELRFLGATWTAVALAPWLALSGLPRAGEDGVARSGAWLVPLALALPTVGVAAGLDFSAAAGRTSLVAAGGLLLVALWSRAAEVGVRGAAGPAAKRPRTVYGVLWLLLVPGTSAAVWALGWAPGAVDGAWPQALELFAPLPWLAACAGRGAEPATGRLLLGLAGNVGLVLVVGGLARTVRGGASA